MKLKTVISSMAVFFGVMFLLCLYGSYRLEKMELDLHNDFVEQVESLGKKKKIVLMYNHMDERSHPLIDSYCLDPSGVEYQRKFCPHKCFYTDDKSVLDFAHAVIFSGTNLETKHKVPVGLPSIRHQSQSWVLLNMESPLYPIMDFQGRRVPSHAHFPSFENQFNLTMSYRRDADVRVPFGRVLRKIRKHAGSYGRTPNMTQLYQKKTHLVAWISSNCFVDRSGRTSLVAQLQQFVQVDIFGDCGVHRCGPPTTERSPCHDLKACYQLIGRRYKFLLALESALCEDYVTEKFFYALEVGMVPIVFGKVNYSDIAVPGSFINVMDFGSVKELAVHLKYLDENPEAYVKFFKWHERAFVTRTFHWHMAWCSLCSKLWDLDEQRNLVSSEALLRWWPDAAIRFGVCDEPPDFITNTTLKFEMPLKRNPVRPFVDFMEEL